MQHVLFRGVGHKLSAKTAEEAVTEAKLDWNVFKANLQTTEDFNGQKIPIVREMGIFRQDTNFPLGVVSRSYGVIQNIDAASILNDVIDHAPAGSPISFRHGACLFGGDKIFITAEIGSPILIGRESFSRFIIISWGHNGGVALKASFALCRIKTGTIINVKMRGVQSDIKIRHSNKANERLKIASRVIENAFTYFEKISDKFSLLADSVMTDTDFTSLLDEILPLPKDGTDRSNTLAENQRDEAKTIYSAEDNYGNKLGAFMAISEWNSNKRTAVHKAKETWGKSEVEVNGTLFGNRNKEMKNAFLKLLENVSEEITA